MDIFLFIFFSIMIYYQILNIASCVIQQDFAAYPFYVVIQLSSLVQLFAARQGCSTPVFPESPNSCPVSWRCHPTYSSSVTPFSSCPQSFLESGSFPMNWLLPSSGQSIEVSASASVLSMNIQDWFPLVLIALTTMQPKRLSRVFSSTTVREHFIYNEIIFLCVCGWCVRKG